MALYGFKAQFVDKILNGSKAHTIRDRRKRATKPGETLYLYTGLRQKGARKIGEAICEKVEDIVITEGGSIGIDGRWLTKDQRHGLALMDGFASLRCMMQFWEGRLPFDGEIIYWHNFKPDAWGATRYQDLIAAGAAERRGPR
jgi:hypothetical protein